MEIGDDAMARELGWKSSRGSGLPRLFIKEMVMRDFKSYAGEQRIGPFHKMRLNKVSELIHNSANHHNLDSAGVSIHFQEIVDLDDGGYEALPGSDFEISRVALRDNSSKYYINNRLSNFTEVTKLLRGKGVDLDNNRFLILQGEVEQISLMKPKAQGRHDEGFLEYLEDISGTNKYIEKLDELVKELESLNEKRSGVVQMVKLAEKERDSLEELDNNLLVCKDEFKEFERQNVGYREDLKHIKKVEGKLEKYKAGRSAFEDAQKQMDDIKGNIEKRMENIANIQQDIQKKRLEEMQVSLLHKLKKVSTREGVPLLFDLIKVQDERVKLAFYAMLGNTVVAENINQATGIAYGGSRKFRRVETLDGELTEKSGTMSGGRSKPRGAPVSAEAIGNAENELLTLSDKLSNLRQQIGDAVRRYQSFEIALANLEMELPKCHNEVDSLHSQHSYLENRLASLEAASKPGKDELDRLEQLKKITHDEEKEIGRIMLGYKKLKDMALELMKKIDAGTEKMRAQKSRVSKIQSLIDEHREVLEKAESEYGKVRRSVDELLGIRGMKKTFNELELEAKSYQKRHDDLQVALTKHMGQIHKDSVDPAKLQATLTDKSLTETCHLRRALEMVALLEAQLKEMSPNLDSFLEYRKKVALYGQRVDDLNHITQQRDDIKKQYDGWRKKRLDEFMAGFDTVSLKLKETYQMITLGGDAELELVDSLDPFSEGVVFSVRPPNKSWRNIANLSGGEKTLSSLALVFVLHHYNPTPLYVMDEIDAALETSKMFLLWDTAKDQTKDAQFIIISLRNSMFELADRLVGIYKTDDCSRSITINQKSFVVCADTA
ncbi:hypothetical protein NL676_029612 [Syzygium grande]|nr:hypothetical protein NL676_029612 [Syzygium grande]